MKAHQKSKKQIIGPIQGLNRTIQLLEPQQKQNPNSVLLHTTLQTTNSYVLSLTFVISRDIESIIKQQQKKALKKLGKMKLIDLRRGIP